MKVTAVTYVKVEISYVDFLNWLNEKGILHKFLENLRSTSSSIEDLLKQHPKEWMNGAFVWSKAPEGHKFWSCVNQEWSRFRESLTEGADSENVIWVVDGVQM